MPRRKLPAMIAPAPQLVHGTCVAVTGRGVLLRGPSGSGKSDLALRLIDRGGELVADDQVALTPERGAVVARAPAKLAGLIEVRGIGIIRRLPRFQAPVALLVDLVARDAVERMPMPAVESLCDIPVSRMRLNPFDASAAIKIELALGVLDGSVMVLE